ncbi:MAG: hypothetical protein CMJ39_03775 [Phycisphaerae bacterium]|nr:hypothetical protein [Phycisphaerae bacterium]
MNYPEPMLRFLGIRSDADQLDVLALGPEQVSESTIKRALADRLKMIDEHPDGASNEADQVREHLRDAAASLLDPRSRMAVIARHVPEQLRQGAGASTAGGPLSVAGITDFDREVLGVLVSSGGWNKESRARLMGLAATHGVPPSQLLEVLMGMTNWLREGGRESTVLPAESGSAAQAAINYKRAHHGSEAFDRFVDRWAPDLRSSESASVTRLSVIFGCIAMVLIVLIVGFLLTTPDSAEELVDDSQLASAQVDDDGAEGHSSSDNLLGGFQLEDVSGGGEILLTTIELPRSLQDAADGVVDTTLGFNLLADSIAQGDSIDLLAARFAELVGDAGKGWFLAAPGSRLDLMQSIIRAFVAVGDDGQLGDQMLGILAPPNPGPILIEQIPEAAWGAGVLGELSQDASISPMIRDQARSLLAARGIGAGAQPGFASGSLGWLRLRIPRLVEESEILEEAELAWHAWIESVKSVPDKPESQLVLLAAVNDVVYRGLDIGQPGPTRRILARLLSSLDFVESPAVREQILNLYVDLDLSSSRLWIVTNLLARLAESEWFDESSVVDPAADASQRRRQHDGLESRWPKPMRIQHERLRAIPAGFDPGLVDIWVPLWDEAMLELPEADNYSVMVQLLRLRRLNEAASALADGDSAAGMGVLRSLETVEAEVEAQADDQTSGNPPVAAPVTPPASPGGSGGGVVPRMTPGFPASQPSGSGFNSTSGSASRSSAGWARRMNEARTRKSKLEVLDELNRYRSGELTEDDASVLARVIYTETSSISEHARAIVERKFLDDPELLIALLDLLPLTRPNNLIAEFIEIVVDRALPEPSSLRWQQAARRALVEQSLALRIVDAAQIDDLVDQFAWSAFAEERRLLGMGVRLLTRPGPVAILRGIAAARADRIRAEMNTEDGQRLVLLLRRIEARERLAGDEVQRALVQQLAILDLLAMEYSIIFPSLAMDIEMAVDDAVVRLPASAHVLEQMLVVEESMGEIWKLILLEMQQRSREEKEAMG